MSHTPVPSENIDVLKYQESLKSWLRSYPQFSDYDFEGSNLSVLIGLLSFNAYNLAHYDSMVGNEAWVDTAELRQSQVSHATDLNYLPRSRISARATLELEVYPNDNPGTIVLPKYFRFKSQDSAGNSIFFVTNQDYVAARDIDGRYIFRDVIVYEGEIIEDFFDVSGITQENGITFYDTPFVLSSENVDITSLEVFVMQNSNDPNPVKYNYSKTLDQTSSTSTTHFLRGIYDNQYAVEFGDGVFGAPLVNGNVVKAVYRTSRGPVIQGNYQLTKVTGIGNYTDVVINSITRVQGGFERESVSELRSNAPKYFQTQDRAVTDIDYEVIIKTNFPEIQQVHAFGGELVQQYGKVMIVLKPFGTTGIVSDLTKNQIIQLLKTKNIVPEPIIINPSYFFIGINGTAFYRGDIAKLTEDQMKTNIVTALTALNLEEIGDFNIRVPQSLITDTIDDSDRSITGSDITMDLRKRWNPGLNINETLAFTTHNTLYKSRDGRYRSPDDYAITSSIFQVFINGTAMDVIVQDDGEGKLFYYQVVSGTKIKIDGSIGTVDYTTGKVNLIANILSYNGNYIEFIMRMADGSLKAEQDAFFIIDGRGVNTNLVRV